MFSSLESTRVRCPVWTETPFERPSIRNRPDSAIVAALSGHSWDVVVIGGGIRKPEPLLTVFEQVVNLVRRHAPQAAIAFNTSGGDSVEAAKRWL